MKEKRTFYWFKLFVFNHLINKSDKFMKRSFSIFRKYENYFSQREKTGCTYLIFIYLLITFTYSSDVIRVKSYLLKTDKMIRKNIYG